MYVQLSRDLPSDLKNLKTLWNDCLALSPPEIKIPPALAKIPRKTDIEPNSGKRTPNTNTIIKRKIHLNRFN